MFLGLGIGLSVLATGASGSAIGQEGSPVGPVIDIYAKESGNWFDAAVACANRGARLCRPSEWIAACRTKRFEPSGQPEWVDQVAPMEGRSAREFSALAIYPCEDAVWAYPSKEYFPFRCCQGP
jgi:hypothetical protein